MHFDQLKRREFITLLGGAAAWPLAARAPAAGQGADDRDGRLIRSARYPTDSMAFADEVIE